MQKWVLKAFTQRCIGMMPARHRINRFFQERVTRSIQLTREDFENHLRRDAIHLDTYESLAGKPLGGTVLEIGTGWHPILPIAFYLCGSGPLTTVDIAANLTASHTQETIDAFLTAAHDGRLATLLPALRADRLAQFRTAAAEPWTTPAEFLAKNGITPLVSAAPYPTLKDHSTQFIVSNVALEYLSREELAILFAEFARVLSPAGVMSHDSCLMDQYHAFDASISRLNFLRFSDRVWKVISNPLIPMSRLRSPEFIEAFQRAGFEVELTNPTRVSEEELQSVPLNERFRRFSSEDLRILRGCYVSRGRRVAKDPPRHPGVLCWALSWLHELCLSADTALVAIAC